VDLEMSEIRGKKPTVLISGHTSRGRRQNCCHERVFATMAAWSEEDICG
jgi:hypothetical protein